jgi:hypothetical protein
VESAIERRLDELRGADPEADRALCRRLIDSFLAHQVEDAPRTVRATL